MKKIIVLLMSLVLSLSACSFLVACGGDSATKEGCLTIRYFKGGYGDEWLKDSVKNFFVQEKGYEPEEDKDYKLIADSSVTDNQANYLKSDNTVPDILMTQGGYEAFINEGLIENISDVYSAKVKKLDGSEITVKDYMLPAAYQGVTRQMKYGVGSNYSWVMPWSAECFSLAYNEDLMKETVHKTSSGEVAGLADGAKWGEKVPATIDELLAYFADVNAGNNDREESQKVVPFGWSYPSSLPLEFIVTVWWAQIQGTKNSKIAGEGSFYDFFNFNSLDNLDQTGIQMGYDVLRSLILDKDGNYINSDNPNIATLESGTYNYNASQGRYAVWVCGDFYENETIKEYEPDFTTKFMFVPNAKGADGKLTEEKITYIRTDEAFYIPAKAVNKALAKEFLAFMCNESELLNYTKKSGGLRPFDYNPIELDPNHNWTDFQKSFFNIYNNADEVIIEYPANVEDASQVSPVYLYNRQSIHFFMLSFANLFKEANKTKSAKTIMEDVKKSVSDMFETWQLEYSIYFNSLV